MSDLVGALDAQVVEVQVRYHADASRLFEILGGTAATDVVLLESADITTRSGLHSLAVLESSVRVTCDDDAVTVEPLTVSGDAIAQRLRQQLGGFEGEEGTFVFPRSTAADERERLLAPSNVAPLRALAFDAGYEDPQGDLPMVAGGFAFDFLATFEDLPPVGAGPNTYPDYQFVAAEIVLLIDHESQTAKLKGVDIAGGDVKSRMRELATLIDEARTEHAPSARGVSSSSNVLVAHADLDDEAYRADVSKLMDDIYNGDIYQVVPARAFSCECPDAFAAYKALRDSNPSPYMFYVRGLDVDGTPYELFGASPESSLKFEAATREVQLYPIAGTRPRGLNADGSINHELDTRMELQLRTDSKEVAEHTMLVDLARNDMARVAVPGTRRVRDLLQVDRYSRVMHLVSRVTATLDEELDALDAYRACMNMGTLTGAPKLRATELLREREGARRGSYGGAVGYLKGNGDMDTCIVIRSAYVSGGTACVQAGAGVVRDSNPQSEADETLHKAYAVLSAIAHAAGARLEVDA
ncbi:anthranilate synthase component 1 [Corynebacterium aquatimens]|uniref:anthranilate synthase n=1 Tax=Corynebacterium aquatimens TaxID=1190508 RepID=A0A931DWD5_9CORY|nr:anthranilate synthase component 1 [Corynebacterium aquatimens]MBG6122739.1 anthranilate synthase component 1 [Corynebacterium aquatimens]WJY66924.1 Anthranilate synthase component 1 [Corynebacterium aquatimens]